MPGLLHFGRKAGARFLVHFLPPQSLHRDKALLSTSLKLVVFCIDPSILLDFESKRRASPALISRQAPNGNAFAWDVEPTRRFAVSHKE